MSSRRRIRFVSYDSARIETIRFARQLAGIEGLERLNGGDWLELELGPEIQTKLDALAERGVVFEFHAPPKPAAPLEPPAPLETSPSPAPLPAGFDTLASLHFGGGGGVRAARALADRFEGLDLRDAIELTRSGGQLAADLPLSEARAHADALAERGVRIEIIPITTWTYAFVPNHERGADQALERMRVVGPELVLEHGRLGTEDWAPLRRERLPSLSERDAVVAACQASWREAGREWVETPAELVSALRKRNPALEQQIRAAPDPRSLLAVYTDWLMARGDPLGQLPEAAAKGDKAFMATLAEHELHLFWPLGRAREHARLSWVQGLVHRACVELPRELDGFETPMDMVETLLDLPCCAGLRELELSGDRLAITPDFVVDALLGLRKLRLDGGLTGDVIVSDWSRLQRLETLEVRAHHPKFAPFRLPKLHRLRLRYDRLTQDGVDMFELATFGALERLELVGEDRPERSDRIERVLNSPALSSVKTAKIEVHGTRVNETFVEAIVNSRLYRSARMIELVAELDRRAEACAGRAAPTLRVHAGPYFPWD